MESLVNDGSGPTSFEPGRDPARRQATCGVGTAELTYGVSKSGSSRNREALEIFLAPSSFFLSMKQRAGHHDCGPCAQTAEHPGYQ